jgi:hypothetical protein
MGVSGRSNFPRNIEDLRWTHLASNGDYLGGQWLQTKAPPPAAKQVPSGKRPDDSPDGIESFSGRVT